MSTFKKNIISQLLLVSCLFIFSTSCGSEDDGGTTMQTPVNVSIQDLSIQEGSITKNAFVRLQLSASSDQLITVYVSTKEVSASAGDDYTGFSNVPLVFTPGDLIKDFQIQIIGDEDFEGDEVFEVSIVDVEGSALIERGTAFITIVNDDASEAELMIPETGYSTPVSYPNMDLIWQDEFSASELDLNYWTFEIGTGQSGWGNNELQFYKKENTSLVDGFLVIEAKTELTGTPYSSSRIISKNKFDFQYGRVDIRAALPTGQGIWPALWMLGGNIDAVSWPACGEIDIMEIIGSSPNVLHGTAHWKDGNGQYASNGGAKTLSSGIFMDEFHVFSIVWDNDRIKWLLDDVEYHTLDITSASLSEFHQDFYFIMNVAVGGNWPGSPNASTVFPQRMIVDYIRVFQ